MSSNRFALKGTQKWGFREDFGGNRAKIFDGNPSRNATTADLRRLMTTLWRCSKYPRLYTRGKEITKKRNVHAVRVHFTPVQFLPPKLLVTLWCMWGPMGDVITHAQFQLNRFRGQGATVPQYPYFL